MIRSFPLPLTLPNFPSPSVFCFRHQLLNFGLNSIKNAPANNGMLWNRCKRHHCSNSINYFTPNLCLVPQTVKFSRSLFFTTLFAQKDQFELPEGIPEIFRWWHFASTLFRSLLINCILWNSLQFKVKRLFDFLSSESFSSSKKLCLGYWKSVRGNKAHVSENKLKFILKKFENLTTLKSKTKLKLKIEP